MVADPLQVAQCLDKDHVRFGLADLFAQAIDVCLSRLQVEPVKLILEFTGMSCLIPIPIAEGLQGTHIGGIRVLAELVQFLERLRAKDHVVFDADLRCLCEVLREVAHAFDVGDQVLDLKAVSLLSYTEVSLQQLVDESIQCLTDWIHEFLLLLQHPIGGIPILG